MPTLQSIKLNNLATNQLSRLEIYKSLCLQLQLVADNQISWEQGIDQRWRGLRQAIAKQTSCPPAIPPSTNHSAFSWVAVSQIIPNHRLLSAGPKNLRQLVQQLVLIPHFPSNLDSYFALSRPSRPIKLAQINLPAGPLYIVLSGHERVGACHLAGLQQIPCEVVNINKNPYKLS